MMRERLYSRKFIHLLCIESTLQFGLYLMNPIVSSYAVALGASVAVAGLVAGLNSTTSILLRPISGLITDRLDKKSLLVCAAVLFATAAFGCSLAKSIVVVGLCRALQGLAFAFKSAIVVSLAALVVPRSRLGGGVGSLGMAFTVACALGPAAGAWLSSVAGLSTCFFAAGILFSVGLVLALTFQAPISAGSHRIEPEQCPMHLDKKERRLLSMAFKQLFYAPALPLTAIIGLIAIGQGTNVNLIILVGNLCGISGASAYFLVYAGVTFFSKPLAGTISDKFGVAAVIVPMSLVAMFGMALLAVRFTFATVLVAAVCMGAGHGSVFATIQSECVRGVPAEKVGRAANMFYLGSDFGMGMGPFISGFVLQNFGIAAAYLTVCFAILLGLLLFLVLRKLDIMKRNSR